MSAFYAFADWCELGTRLAPRRRVGGDPVYGQATMKKYTVGVLARALTKAARLYPASYVFVFKLFCGYNFIVSRLVKSAGDKNDSSDSSAGRSSSNFGVY